MRAQLARESTWAKKTACICISRWARRWRMRRNMPASFAEYARGNALRRDALRYDAGRNRRNRGQRSKALFTREFLCATRGTSAARRPIRFSSSGSHALGLDLDRANPCEPFRGGRHDGIAGHPRRSRGGSRRKRTRAMRPAIPRSAVAGCRSSAGSWARNISARTRIQRKTARPFFIDKMPNNWTQYRLYPSHPAERQDHRCAPASARLLLLKFQAAVRPGPGLLLQSRRLCPLLPRLRRS